LETIGLQLYTVRRDLEKDFEGTLAQVAKVGFREVELAGLFGRPPKDEVTRLMQDAAVLVFPSEVYEGFPVTIAEAFATGLPVVASRLGAMIELIDHDRTGAHFTPGDAADLRRVMRRVFTDPDRLRRLSRGARADFEQKYTCERNYEILSGIYRSALPSHATGSLRAQPLRP